MEQITAYLKDPAWWFSAFFVAILASIVAAFVKDYLQAAVGWMSSSARKQFADREQRREVIVTALASNDTFLILTMVRAVAMLVLMGVMLTIFMLSPMLHDVLAALCQSQSQAPKCPSPSDANIRSTILYVAIGSATIFVVWRTMGVTSLAMSGYKRFRKAHGFPAVK